MNILQPDRINGKFETEQNRETFGEEDFGFLFLNDQFAPDINSAEEGSRNRIYSSKKPIWKIFL